MEMMYFVTPNRIHSQPPHSHPQMNISPDINKKIVSQLLNCILMKGNSIYISVII